MVTPTHRLARHPRPERTPLVLVACGSFSPITRMHLRMFDLAAEHAEKQLPRYEVVGGYLSPVSDRYNKAGLASAVHRVKMCQLAADRCSTWVMVDPWEAGQTEYQPTAIVLDHVAREVRAALGWPVKVMLLAGSDLLRSMSTPGVWSRADLTHILGCHGVVVVERAGEPVEEAVVGVRDWWRRCVGEEGVEDCLRNVHVVGLAGGADDASSTRIRRLLRMGASVSGLVPPCVAEYIAAQGLYRGVEEFRESRASSMPPLSRGGAGGEE